MTTYEKYAWGTAEEAAQHTADSYERYLVPSIGVPSARPVIEAAALQPDGVGGRHRCGSESRHTSGRGT